MPARASGRNAVELLRGPRLVQALEGGVGAFYVAPVCFPWCSSMIFGETCGSEGPKSYGRSGELVLVQSPSPVRAVSLLSCQHEMLVGRSYQDPCQWSHALPSSLDRASDQSGHPPPWRRTPWRCTFANTVSSSVYMPFMSMCGWHFSLGRADRSGAPESSWQDAIGLLRRVDTTLRATPHRAAGDRRQISAVRPDRPPRPPPRSP